MAESNKIEKILDHEDLAAKRYRNLVRKAIRDQDSEPVFNGSCEHAAILLSEMFESAESEMCILSECLLPECYNSGGVPEAFAGFLKRGGKARIVLEDDSKIGQHPLAELLSNDQCKIVPLADSIRDQVTYHMALMDKSGYRFESDKDTPEAIAAFGDEKGALHLMELFEDIWQLSEQKH